MKTKDNLQYPMGAYLFCEVFYLIEYVGVLKPEDASETFSASYGQIFPDPVLGPTLAIAAAKSARTALWNMWADFRNGLESKPKIDRLMVKKTEYWTDSNTDRKFVTAFIHEFVRSIPGDFSIPSEF